MQQVFRKYVLRQDEPPHPTIEAIREVCARMECGESQFAQEVDPDLIEGCIYEMESLRARYRYLLRTAREQQIRCHEKKHLWNE